MFDFLKKKLKDSIDKAGEKLGLKKKEPEKKIEEEPIEREDILKTAEKIKEINKSAKGIEDTPEKKLKKTEKELKEFGKRQEKKTKEEIKEIEQSFEKKEEKKPEKKKEEEKPLSEIEKLENDFEKIKEKTIESEYITEDGEDGVKQLAKGLEKIKQSISEKPDNSSEKRSGLFGIIKKVIEKKVSKEEFDSIFEDIKLSLLENNVAYEVVELIKNSLEKELVGNTITRNKFEEIIKKTISKTIENILIEPDVDKLLEEIKKGKPYVMMFVGVNGVGKTTCLAKTAKWLMDKNFKVVFSASDTFRAASIEQLEEHAKNLGVKVIKHQYGADAAAVAFDAITHAKQKGIDIVLIDTAGRQQANVNLMAELEKIKRVCSPDISIFCADALTGNDAVEQAREFYKIVEFNYSILNKTDVDRKGGAVLSVAYITKKPILFLGTGQNYGDLEVFRKQKVIEKLFNE